MREGVESLGRLRAKGIALLAVTFAVGGLVGIAVERTLLQREPEPVTAPGPGPGWPDGRVLPPMFRELGLTPQQIAEIRGIMERRKPATDSLLDELLPRLRAMTDSTRAEVRGVLTTEQAALWDSLMAGRRHRGGPMGRPGMRGRGPGRREPPPPQLP